MWFSILLLAGLLPENLPTGSSAAQARGRASPRAIEVSENSPREAVESLARTLVGEGMPIEVAANAFEGLPAPAPGIRYFAQSGGLDKSALRMAVTVEARSARHLLARRSYVFPLLVVEPVVVPKRVIPSGTTIRSEDLHVREVPLNDGLERYALSLDVLVGRIARRTLLADRPVPSRMLERPAAVKRSSTVIVQVISGPMRVTMEGEALEDGAVGDVVKVLNPSSNRALTGRVVDSGLVEVIR